MEPRLQRAKPVTPSMPKTTLQFKHTLNIDTISALPECSSLRPAENPSGVKIPHTAPSACRVTPVRVRPHCDPRGSSGGLTGKLWEAFGSFSYGKLSECPYLQDSDPISLLFLGDVHFLRDVTSLGCGPPGMWASWGCSLPGVWVSSFCVYNTWC